VIADDSVLLREGIAQLLRREGFTVAETVGTAEALLDAVAAAPPDVAVVDIRMPPTHTDEGLAAAATLRRRHPGLGILLLSQWVHAGRALDLFRDGGAGMGYLLKDRVTEVDEWSSSAMAPLPRPWAIWASTCRSRSVSRRNGFAAGLAASSADTTSGSRTDAPRATRHIASVNLGRKTVETHVNAIFTKLDLEPAADDNRRVLAALAWLRGQ
jgi:DNA-binding NarL/FixJ family response regulator